jgi:hypothetical protein
MRKKNLMRKRLPEDAAAITDEQRAKWVKEFEDITKELEDRINEHAKEAKPCPYPFPEDDGTAKDCINKGHCGCILNREEAKP